MPPTKPVEVAAQMERVVSSGVRFLTAAVEEMALNDPDRQAIAVLHLATSIEVLVKARLAEEHWTLILQSPDRVTHQKFKNGKFQSVSAINAVERLRDLCAVHVGEDDIGAVTAVVELRNRVAHFALTAADEPEVETVLARGLLFLIKFLRETVEPEVSEGLRKTLESARRQSEGRLNEIREAMRLRLEALAPRLENQPVVLDCPYCEQAAVVLGTEGAFCYFCGRPTDIEDYLESQGRWRYVDIAESGAELSETCPDCGLETLVRIDLAGPDPVEFVCFSCGEDWRAGVLEPCTGCGVLQSVSEQDGVAFCQNCWDHATRE